MEKISRRELLQRAGVAAAIPTLGATLRHGLAVHVAQRDSSAKAPFEWFRSARLLIAEGYTPPFYPSLDYEPERALVLARQLNCDSIRYPTFSYLAFFPTKTKFPRHPELGSRDPFRRTVELFHDVGLKVVAYNPLNHPFMDVRSNNPDYRDWMRYDAEGQPMITPHYGWTRFYEGCLNSPLRLQIRERVREVVTDYPVDVMYFDGPYQGMGQQARYCHCKYCKAAYSEARGKVIPLENGSMTLEDEIEYREWLSRDVVGAFLKEICDIVHRVRDVPVVYNDTGLLSKEDWRSRAFGPVDGFMFEAAETPEQKLFNLRLGQSTGKVIWTYIGSHTQYNREHLTDKAVRGWFTYPVEGERLLLDAAVATATGAGYCYWGLNRVFYLPQDIMDYRSVKSVKAMFDFAHEHEALLRSVRPAPQAGILIGTQTIRWFREPHYLPQAYKNYYNGAFQLLKDAGYDAEPFLDYETTEEKLSKFGLVYVPNVPCLSEAQCSALLKYVESGGQLIATHMTSIADEYGRSHENLKLSSLLGATLIDPQPVEIPDLYLRLLPSRRLIPQDPQVMRFKAADETEVLAETFSRGFRQTLGPAIVRHRFGRGQAVYIGSGLEAIYEETLNDTLRNYFRSLVDPILGPTRHYELEFRSGLTAEFATSDETLLLHLLADTGNIWKKLLVQEEFLPIQNVNVRIRLPQKRSVKSVTLLWSGTAASWTMRNGWVEVTVPQVLTYELVHVDLA